ncbi:MAG TPA: DUF4271 domain-containing protein [Chitinophagaceae bacterium]|nr:DUF4271 domain-containing protein [Chitinophagaceae bacterium]
MKSTLLILYLLVASSIMAQDSIIKESDSQRVRVADTIVRPVKKLNPDSLRTVDSLKAIADSILHTVVEKKTKSVQSQFNIPPYPSVYGQWVGGFLKNDKRYNVTAPVLRVRELVRVPPSFEWIFYLFCGVLLLLSFLRLAFYKFFTDLFKVFFNTSMRQKQIREQLSQSPLPSLLLNIFFFITGGIFIYFLSDHYGFNTGYSIPVTVLICMGALTLLYLGKYIFLSMAGWMFDRKAASENYMFSVFMVNKMTGLFLVPMDILMAYSDHNGRQVVITLTVIGLIILGIVRMVRGYQSVSNILKINPLHFIMYVAAFEVIPVLLIYKVLLIVIR